MKGDNYRELSSLFRRGLPKLGDPRRIRVARKPHWGLLRWGLLAVLLRSWLFFSGPVFAVSCPVFAVSCPVFAERSSKSTRVVFAASPGKWCGSTYPTGACQNNGTKKPREPLSDSRGWKGSCLNSRQSCSRSCLVRSIRSTRRSRYSQRRTPTG